MVQNFSTVTVMHIYLTGDLIMVTLPGHFVHLLNVGIEFEPCHHILLHSKLTPTVFLQGQNFGGSLMTLCLKYRGSSCNFRGS